LNFKNSFLFFPAGIRDPIDVYKGSLELDCILGKKPLEFELGEKVVFRFRVKSTRGGTFEMVKVREAESPFSLFQRAKAIEAPINFSGLGVAGIYEIIVIYRVKWHKGVAKNRIDYMILTERGSPIHNIFVFLLIFSFPHFRRA
jgi:hypothetical protein